VEDDAQKTGGETQTPTQTRVSCCPRFKAWVKKQPRSRLIGAAVLAVLLMGVLGVLLWFFMRRARTHAHQQHEPVHHHHEEQQVQQQPYQPETTTTTTGFGVGFGTTTTTTTTTWTQTKNSPHELTPSLNKRDKRKKNKRDKRKKTNATSEKKQTRQAKQVKEKKNKRDKQKQQTKKAKLTTPSKLKGLSRRTKKTISKQLRRKKRPKPSVKAFTPEHKPKTFISTYEVVNLVRMIEGAQLIEEEFKEESNKLRKSKGKSKWKCVFIER